MKLTSQQVTLIIVALRLHQRDSLDDEEIKECDALCELLNIRDVWAVRPGLIEQLGKSFEKLTGLHDELRKNTSLLITTIQKRCPHRFHKPNPDGSSWRPIKTDSCQICGKEEK